MESPHMTHLYGDTRIPKHHPRIVLRGKLDSLQAKVALTQCDLEGMGTDPEILADLQDILEFLREVARCEILDTPLLRDKIFGLSFDELQDRSHNAARYFGVATMTLPEPGLGRGYALLNCLRTAVRETEVAAVATFEDTRSDLVAGLNRLSSAVHILMCRCL